MELSWGVDLWDRLDEMINHSNVASNFMDKFQKCMVECHQVWSKALHKQKRLLEKLQAEINEPAYTEFTMTTGLMSIINNFISIYNIKSTFSNSVAIANEECLKKAHSQIKKQSIAWVNEKRKMEDDLSKQRRRYDNSLKRYRDKYQAMLVAQDNYKRSEDNRSLSRMQLDTCYQQMISKKDEYDQSKQDYAVEFRDFNQLQKSHFDVKVIQWAKKGENIYDQKLNMLKDVSNQFSKLTGDMINKLNYSVTRFTDVGSQVNFTKDAILLIQKYKTGDVPPLELQFIDMDYKQYSSKSEANKREFSEESSSDSQISSSNDSIDGPVITRPHANSTSNSSIYTSSFSHDNRSDPTRSSGQSSRPRTTGTAVNPEAKFSIQKSVKIFKSSTPWKQNDQSEASSQNKSTVKQPSLYQRRGRNATRQLQSTRRSRSVTDMISNVFRSSLRLKNKDDKSPERKKDPRVRSPSQSQIETCRQSISDFDSDSDINEPNEAVRHRAPDIVSTPAEAVAAWNRKMSAPDFQLAERIYNTMNRADSPISLNEKSTNEKSYRYDYVGSCVSQHDYDSEDPSNNYLSFECGDQFYIVKMDDGSGWLYVETMDQSALGYVPSSYMEIRHFDNLSEAIV